MLAFRLRSDNVALYKIVTRFYCIKLLYSPKNIAAAFAITYSEGLFSATFSSANCPAPLTDGKITGYGKAGLN
jgi:hypothetical protein